MENPLSVWWERGTEQLMNELTYVGRTLWAGWAPGRASWRRCRSRCWTWAATRAPRGTSTCSSGTATRGTPTAPRTTSRPRRPPASTRTTASATATPRVTTAGPRPAPRPLHPQGAPKLASTDTTSKSTEKFSFEVWWSTSRSVFQGDQWNSSQPLSGALWSQLRVRLQPAAQLACAAPSPAPTGPAPAAAPGPALRAAPRSK